ncbi:MAG: pirin family protein [Bacteroidetes bacterium]|nr:pirin family protein [Bacteroidota bacterium]
MKYSSLVKIPPTGGRSNLQGNTSFSAFQARNHSFDGLMNPVLGFDHFRLTSDVFGPHRHAGMSAISYVFEDSVPYHNEDSMGTNLTITPGSLLWTWAGSGVVHHETPTVKGEVHGLQLFLDIAPENKSLPPKSVFIPVEKMPILSNNGVSVKVVMGPENPVTTPEPVTFLDVTLKTAKTFDYTLPAGNNGTIYVLSGTVVLAPAAFSVSPNEAIAFGAADTDEKMAFIGSADSRFLLISGPPVQI